MDMILKLTHLFTFLKKNYTELDGDLMSPFFTANFTAKNLSKYFDFITFYGQHLCKEIGQGHRCFSWDFSIFCKDKNVTYSAAKRKCLSG